MTPEAQIPAQPTKKLQSVSEFAARIRTKYPQYGNLDDGILVSKILKKYPKYADRVDLGPDARAQAEGEVNVARQKLEEAKRSYQSTMSTTGRSLNPPVTGKTEYFRPLTATEKAAQQRGQPVIISEAQIQAQTPATTPEMPSRPRRVTEAPVSLDPVIQSRLEQIQKQQRRKEAQQRVAKARAIRQGRPDIVAALQRVAEQANQIAPYVRKHAVPLIDKSIPDLTKTALPHQPPPLTFAEDRAQRVAMGQPPLEVNPRAAEAHERPGGMVMAEFRRREQRDLRIANEIRPQVIKDYFGMGAGVRQELPPAEMERQIAADPRLRDYIEAETQRRAKALEEREAQVYRVERGFAPPLGVVDKIRELRDKPEQLIPFLSSIPEINNLRAVSRAAEKIDRNEPLTKEEEVLLREFVSASKQDQTYAYQVANVLSALPAFVGEFALTGGVYTAGKKAALKGLERLLTKEGLAIAERKLAGRVARKVATGLVGAAAQTLPAGATRIPAGVLYRQQEGQEFGAALRDTLTDQFIEIASERAGGLLSEIPLPKKLAAIRDAVTARWIDKVPGRTAEQLQKLVKKSGWNGPLGEIFEERVGDAAKYATGLQPSPIPTLKQLAVEGLAFSLPGAVEAGTAKVLQGTTRTTSPVADYIKASPLSTAEEKAAVEAESSTLDQKPEARAEKPNVLEAITKKPQQIQPDQPAEARAVIPTIEPAVTPPAEVKTQPSAMESQLTTGEEVTDEVRAEEARGVPAPSTQQANRDLLNSDVFHQQALSESVGGNAGPNRAAVNMLVDQSGQIVFIGNFQDAVPELVQRQQSGDLQNVAAVVHWPEGLAGKARPQIEAVHGPEPARSSVAQAVPSEWGGPVSAQAPTAEQPTEPQTNIPLHPIPERGWSEKEHRDYMQKVAQAGLSPTVGEQEFANSRNVPPKGINQKLTAWGIRLNAIAQSKSLDELQALSDEMASDKSDPRVARLRTAIQDTLARVRESGEEPQLARSKYSPAVQQAFRDWKERRAYIDNNGNYHVKAEGHPSGPIAPWNKEVKKLFKNASELHAAARAEAESDQPAFAKGEAANVPIIGVESNRVSLDRAGAQLISDAYRASGHLGEKEANIRGAYEKNPERLARTLDQMAAQGRKGAANLADIVRQAADTGKGKIVFFASEGARKHELFHEASSKATQSLRDRHANLDSLTENDTFSAMYRRLTAMGYEKFNMPALVEEAAAHIAEGRYDQLGITREEAVEWMYRWFKSFEAKNPNVNPREFQELAEDAEKARQRVYEATERQQVVNQPLPSVQEGREGGDREGLAAARESEYQGEHAPADAKGGAPLHDLNVNGIYPADVYGPSGLRYYPTGYEALDYEAYSLIKSYRDHPNRPLTIYRAVPKDIKGGISKGDWVTPIRRYAVEHGKDNLGGNYRIQKKRVYARDIFTDGNSWLEWGYDPQPFDIKSERARIARRKAGPAETAAVRQPGTTGAKASLSDVLHQTEDENRPSDQRTGRWAFFRIQDDRSPLPQRSRSAWTGNENEFLEGVSAYSRLLDASHDLLLGKDVDGLGINYAEDVRDMGGNPVLSVFAGTDMGDESPNVRGWSVDPERKTEVRVSPDQLTQAWRNAVIKEFPEEAAEIQRMSFAELDNTYELSDNEVDAYHALRDIINTTETQPSLARSPNISQTEALMARSEDPWAELTRLSEEFRRLANEPELAPGEKPRSLPKHLEMAGLEAGPERGYLPESVVDDGVQRAKALISDKGVDGAIEFVRTGDGIEWASTGYEVSGQLRDQESQLRAEGKTDQADDIRDKRLKFLDDFALGAVERGRSIVGIKAIAEYAPDRMAYMLNKASLKKRKRGISAEEEARIAQLGEELGALEARNKELEKRLAEATSRAQVTSKKTGTKPKKTDYQSRLDQQASALVQTLKPKVGKFDFGYLEKQAKEKFPAGAAQVGIPPLPGDAELLAQYAAAKLATFNTAAELNQHLVQEFGDEVTPHLPKIRQRAYAIRQEARLAEIESEETEPKRRKTILSEIQKEIGDSLRTIREAQKAQDQAAKAERAAQRKSERAEARLEARQARAAEHEARKQEIKEARADLKRLRQEMKEASKAETKGYRETIKAQKEAARRAELWDTPLRNEANAARERLKDKTDIKDPQVIEDLTSVAAAKFLPEKEGGTPRTGPADPAKVYQDLKDEFPKLVTKKNQGEIYKRGYQRIQDATAAAREAARLRSASAEAKRLWDKLGVDVDAQAVLIQQAEVRRQTDELRRKATAEFNRVSRSPLGKLWVESNALFRALQSSIDAPLGRQGWFLVLTHPVLAARYAIPATTRGYTAIHHADWSREVENMRQHPDYRLAVDAGLQITETAGASSDPRLQAEEMFSSTIAEKLPHVRLSEQGYVNAMNTLRLSVFSHLAAIGKAEGKTWESDPQFYEQLASFINNVSGRGTMEHKASVVASFLNGFFYSTRLNVSRFQMLNDLFNPIGYLPEQANPLRDTPGFRSYDPTMRKIAAQHVLRLGVALSSIFLLARLVGFGIEFDPEDPDAFLLRFRNTRWDVTGGEAGTIRFIYRFLHGIEKKATGQELEPFEEPDELVKRFLRYKLAPIPSGVIDALTGKDAVGNKASLTKYENPKQFAQENIIFKRVTPMLVGTFIDTISMEGWLGIPMALPALTGMNVSSYPDRGLRALKNQDVRNALEELKITSQSLLGQKTKDEELDKLVEAKIMAKVETLDLPQGATQVGKEKIIKERLEQIRQLARAEAAIQDPKRYETYLKSKEGSESVSVLTDEEKKSLTEADLKRYREIYAEAYVQILQNAAKSAQWPTLTDDQKQKLLARIPRIAHTRAKIDLVKTKRNLP